VDLLTKGSLRFCFGALLETSSLASAPPASSCIATRAFRQATRVPTLSRTHHQPPLQIRQYVCSCSFLSDSSVDVVPSNWLNGNECLWPSKFRASRAIKAVKLRESPDLTYTRHSIVILSKEDTFQKARSKLRKGN
ncbi:unnamed protein product, partial [Ixodes pacificus]